MTIFEEKDGISSMRRVLAFIFALAAVAFIALSICIGQIYGLYGAALCIVAVLILLGLTTMQDIKEAIPFIASGTK